MATPTYWVGADNNIYYGSGLDGAPVVNAGPAGASTLTDNSFTDPWGAGDPGPLITTQATRINDPNQGGQVLGTSTGGTGGTSAQNLAFLDNQASQLQNLLGRTQTGLDQGLTQNQDQYDTQLGAANNSKDLQYANYADQRVGQNTAKQNAYDTINKNAGTGYRSLAQIIGRSAGTGSSAYQQLLPNVVGKDTSSKRFDATNTYGQNLAGIDKAQNQYDISFQNVLQDLLNQKKKNEDSLRTGVEQQRQQINQQLATNAGQRATAQGGGYAQVLAAAAPFQSAIDNSRNTVESFFNQFRTPYTPTQAVAATPNINAYNTDRAVVNAGQGNPGDASNPYAAQLRKKLQGGLSF